MVYKYRCMGVLLYLCNDSYRVAVEITLKQERDSVCRAVQGGASIFLILYDLHDDDTPPKGKPKKSHM